MCGCQNACQNIQHVLEQAFLFQFGVRYNFFFEDEAIKKTRQCHQSHQEHKYRRRDRKRRERYDEAVMEILKKKRRERYEKAQMEILREKEDVEKRS